MPARSHTHDATERMAPLHSLSDHYELLGRLGEGGMAEVWLARAVGLDDFEKIVVLKRILPHHRENPRFVGMLRDEARVAVHLHHPNIVHTYDIGLIKDEYFVTMEYLHGENVKRIVARAKEAGEAIPLELALQIAVGCCAGLYHAHEQTDYAGEPLRIVHRDVSPANIIVTRHSGVKLIDFGIAKATSRKEVTAVGMVKGKAAYMSPEQCRGEPLDRRSDIFSLGIVLYELLTQRRLFIRENQLATLYAILNHDPEPVRSIRGDCPVELERIVSRALSKRREDRYQTAFEMQEELELATRDCRLHALPGALGRYLEHLFGPKPLPWLAPEPTDASSSKTPFDLLVTAQRRKEIDVPAESASPADVDQVRTEPELQPCDGPRTAPSPIIRPEPAAIPTTSPVTAVAFEARPERRLGVFVGIGATLVVAAIFALRWWSPIGDADDGSAAAARRPAASETAESVVAEADPGTVSARPPVESAPTPSSVADENEDADPDEGETANEPPPRLDAPEEAAEEDDSATQRRPQKRASRGIDPEQKARARSLVAEGQAALIRNESERALTLAKRAQKIHATPDVYALLGAAACKLGRSAEARIAHRHLSGARRADLERVCQKHGTSL